MGARRALREVVFFLLQLLPKSLDLRTLLSGKGFPLLATLLQRGDVVGQRLGLSFGSQAFDFPAIAASLEEREQLVGRTSVCLGIASHIHDGILSLRGPKKRHVVEQIPP
jgi:hypothetical protein